jgi:hypothetical protein
MKRHWKLDLRWRGITEMINVMEFWRRWAVNVAWKAHGRAQTGYRWDNFQDRCEEEQKMRDKYGAY